MWQELLAYVVEHEELIQRRILVGLYIYGPFIFLFQFVFAVPYGRFLQRQFPLTVPARWGWIIQECPAFFVSAYAFFTGTANHRHSWANLALIGMYLFHYAYRSFIYPFRIRGKPSPIYATLSAILTTVCLGWLEGRELGKLGRVYPDSWLWDPRFVAGTALWAAGFYINYRSDLILRDLRKPGDSNYYIPRGGAFEYVSAANYAGEILEWGGWALACWNVPAASFAFFVLCFLGHRSVNVHQWYRNKFKGEYPPNRKACIPFFW